MAIRAVPFSRRVAVRLVCVHALASRAVPGSAGIVRFVATTGRDKKKKGGRRRNYEPTVELTGIKKLLPTGWANWLGFTLFGVCTVALLVEFVVALGRDGHTDWIAAIGLAGLFGWITVLFAITRWKDYI